MPELPSRHPATSHHVSTSPGLSRRELLRRGAVVGGSVLAVQSLGTVAAFAQTSEPPPQPTERPTEPTERPTEPTERPTEPTEAPTDPVEPTVAPSELERPTEPSRTPTDAGRSQPPGGRSRTPSTPSATSTRSSGTAAPSRAGSTLARGPAGTPLPGATAAAAPGDLAHTGLPLPALLGLGAGAVTAGAAALRSGHRRTRPDGPSHDADDGTDDRANGAEGS